MIFDYKELLNNFDYDFDNGYWIRKQDGKAFYLYEKDKDDKVEAREVEDSLVKAVA